MPLSSIDPNSIQSTPSQGGNSRPVDKFPPGAFQRPSNNLPTSRAASTSSRLNSPTHESDPDLRNSDPDLRNMEELDPDEFEKRSAPSESQGPHEQSSLDKSGINKLRRNWLIEWANQKAFLAKRGKAGQFADKPIEVIIGDKGQNIPKLIEVLKHAERVGFEYMTVENLMSFYDDFLPAFYLSGLICVERGANQTSEPVQTAKDNIAKLKEALAFKEEGKATDNSFVKRLENASSDQEKKQIVREIRNAIKAKLSNRGLKTLSFFKTGFGFDAKKAKLKHLIEGVVKRITAAEDKIAAIKQEIKLAEQENRFEDVVKGNAEIADCQNIIKAAEKELQSFNNHLNEILPERLLYFLNSDFTKKILGPKLLGIGALLVAGCPLGALFLIMANEKQSKPEEPEKESSDEEQKLQEEKVKREKKLEGLNNDRSLMGDKTDPNDNSTQDPLQDQRQRKKVDDRNLEIKVADFKDLPAPAA